MANQNQKYNNSSKFTKGNIQSGLYVIAFIGFIIFASFAATENYSRGERIGFITKFSFKGRFWKSWEGELNLTQTGMNTSSLFDFSIDNDNQSSYVVSMIDSAVNNGWKVKLTYHQTYCKNWINNRGETNYFVTGIEILDRSTLGNNFNEGKQGRIIDTVFVVIDKNEFFRKK